MNNIGFIGVGYMGFGIAKNILEKGNNLFVIANKNRKPITYVTHIEFPATSHTHDNISTCVWTTVFSDVVKCCQNKVNHRYSACGVRQIGVVATIRNISKHA